MRRRAYLCLALLPALLWLYACGGRAADTPAFAPADAASDIGGDETPPFAGAAFHPELAVNGAGVQIDLSSAAQGYVAVSAVSDRRLKCQIVMGQSVYNYDLSSDGTPSVYPLQSGSGRYRIRVMENVEGSSYTEHYALSCDAVLADEFQPFLRPNDYVRYDEDSACVAVAAQLSEAAEDELDVTAAIYDYICGAVTYDAEKAATVPSGYLSDPDETLATGRGICVDYAALAAAMLRSRGIPTKLVVGYVAPGGLYHAWNMFYTRQTGWVTADYAARDGWNRLDFTLSAAGADAAFIGDGSNYTDLYYY